MPKLHIEITFLHNLYIEKPNGIMFVEFQDVGFIYFINDLALECFNKIIKNYDNLFSIFSCRLNKDQIFSS